MFHSYAFEKWISIETLNINVVLKMLSSVSECFVWGLSLFRIIQDFCYRISNRSFESFLNIEFKSVIIPLNLGSKAVFYDICMT